MSSDLVDILKCFVPALIVRNLAKDPSPIAEPTAERISAVVLFVDITDFTALADRLSTNAITGSEDLAYLLNDCFGRLINIIHSHGGEVTKFAGDALIALWPVPSDLGHMGVLLEEALADKARIATQCGLAIQKSFRGYLASDGIPLYLQIGIGAGDVYSVYLGGVFDRWEFLLSGVPLVQMSIAKKQAKPGQVVMSPAVWELVKDACVGKPLDKGFIELINQSSFAETKPLNLPSLTHEAIPSLKSYVPAAILSFLEAGYEEWSSELRQLSVMFIKLPHYGTSIKHPYNRTLPEAQSVMQALQTALYKYAGSINKFNVDDKGITLVAAFGLPPLSHSDDAARAVNAALDIQLKLEELSRDCVIGITTGWVFCGPIGNENRREYTMVGTVVNMAARLMQAAEEYPPQNRKSSRTLIDEDTFSIIQMQKNQGEPLAMGLAFESIKLTTVKGKTKPITAYRPQRKLTSVETNLTTNPSKNNIVGMQAERAILSECLQDLLSSNRYNNRNLVIIEAEAGSGKSCLVREVIDTTRRKGIRTLVSAGDSLEQTTPYYAWQRIFQRMFGLETRFSDQLTTRSHVLSQLPPIRGEKGYPAFAIRLSPLLNSVLPLDFPENRTTTKMDSEFRNRITHQYLSRLIQRNVAGIGRKKPLPTVLIFEDGQWLDDASWELLLNVSTKVEPLLTIIATRSLSSQSVSNRLSQINQRLNELPQLTRIKLGPLAEQDNLWMVQGLLGCSKFPKDAFEILRRRTGGSPMFAIELIRDWQKLGLIKIQSHEAILNEAAEALARTPIPIVVHQILTSRIEQLTPDAQIMLKSASILGNEFTLSELYRIYPSRKDEAERHALLEYLLKQGLFERRSSVETDMFGFSNDFIREVAFSLLPTKMRKHLKERVF